MPPLADGEMPGSVHAERIRAAIAPADAQHGDPVLLRDGDGRLDVAAIAGLRRTRNDQRVALAE